MSELQKYNPAQPPSALIEMALSSSADLDKIEKLLELQERWERNEAKKAYVAAMAAFKANPPEIFKDKRVSYEAKGGTTAYSHADLATAAEKISPALSANGLHHAWETHQLEGGMVKVTCTITHVMGHSESTSLQASPDTSGSKNNIQAIGSTISYLQRYTLLSMTGLAAKGMDTDGIVESGPIEYINDAQYASIRDMLDACGATEADEAKFCKYLKIEDINKMPATLYDKAVKALEAKLKAAQK